MGYHEGRREQLKSEHAVLRSRLEVFANERILATRAQRPLNAAKHFDYKRACPATWIKYEDVGIGEAIHEAEFGSKHRVHALDHVVDDFRRRVPDTQALAELGIERLQKGFIEMLYGGTRVEDRKESIAIDPIEGTRGVIENFRQSKWPQAHRIDNLAKQRADHRDAERPRRRAPIKRWPVALVRPDDPSREEAVEEGLHQR